MTEKDDVLAKITELVVKIQRGQSKVGSAIEAYDSDFLWELGNQVRVYTSLVPNHEKAIEEILHHSSSGLVDFQPALLKRADTARRAFPSRDAYLRFSRGISYGKLREVLPIFDPDFVEQQRVSTKDLEQLQSRLPNLTYEETLAEVRKIRARYDPEGVSVDYDQLWEDVEASATFLGEVVSSKDKDAMRKFMKLFDPQFLNNARRLMAAMNDETSFVRLTVDLPKRFGQQIDVSAMGLQGEINRVVHSLSLLRSASPASREILRKRVGKMMIGELSTLMKAASSEDELERYLRSRKIIERLKVP